MSNLIAPKGDTTPPPTPATDRWPSTGRTQTEPSLFLPKQAPDPYAPLKPHNPK